jgi:hypothetical protein
VREQAAQERLQKLQEQERLRELEKVAKKKREEEGKRQRWERIGDAPEAVRRARLQDLAETSAFVRERRRRENELEAERR